MDIYKIANVYANALFDAAKQLKVLGGVEEDLRNLVEIWEKEKHLEVFFASALVPSREKMRILDRLFAKKIEDITLKFLKVLVQRKRIDLLPAIVRRFEEVVDIRGDTIKIHIQTAEPLTPKERDAFTEIFRPHMEKRFEIIEEVHPELMVGYLVSIGDIEVDLSFYGAYQRLKKAIIEHRIDDHHTIIDDSFKEDA